SILLTKPAIVEGQCAYEWLFSFFTKRRAKGNLGSASPLLVGAGYLLFNSKRPTDHRRARASVADNLCNGNRVALAARRYWLVLSLRGLFGRSGNNDQWTVSLPVFFRS